MIQALALVNNRAIALSIAEYATFILTSVDIAHSSVTEKAHFLDEIELMKTIASGQNPHVVKMLGCVVSSEPLFLLTEFMSFGDLLSYLKSIKNMVSWYSKTCL